MNAETLLYRFASGNLTTAAMGNYRLLIPNGIWRVNSVTVQYVGAGAAASQVKWALICIDPNVAGYRVLALTGYIRGDANATVSFMPGTVAQGDYLTAVSINPAPVLTDPLIQNVDSVTSQGVYPLSTAMLFGETRLALISGTAAAGDTFNIYGELERVA
jgi:hypothetical protein